MRYRSLGNSGIQVSEICLGSMTWGEQNSESEGHQQIEFALERGVNFIDTAEMYAIPPREATYGRTEEIIGSWLTKPGNRERVVLASKVVGAARKLPWIRQGNARLDKANLRVALEGSLRRLRTDYIDLYQLHWANRGTYHFGNYGVDIGDVDTAKEREGFLEVIETLNEFMREGKIRAYGISNETAWGAMEYLTIAEHRGFPRMVSIQNEYSLLCRLFDFDLREVAVREGIGLLAWSPLAAGALSGKYLGGAVPHRSRRSISAGPFHRQTPIADEAISAYVDLAGRYGLDPCQLAIAFVLSRPFVTSAIIGATSLEQLATNVGAAGVTLGPEILKEIDLIWRSYPIPY